MSLYLCGRKMTLVEALERYPGIRSLYHEREHRGKEVPSIKEPEGIAGLVHRKLLGLGFVAVMRSDPEADHTLIDYLRASPTRGVMVHYSDGRCWLGSGVQHSKFLRGELVQFDYAERGFLTKLVERVTAN